MIKPRPYFLCAVGAIIAAVVLQSWAASQFRRSAYYGTIFPNLAASQAERDHARLECVRSSTRGQAAVSGGLLFAFGSVVLFLLAVWKNESPPRWIGFGLLCGYLLALFIA